MTAILNRASRNFLWQHPWQLLLAVLGITLGVAVVIAIDLATASSLRVFEQATRVVSGHASHQIIASAGGFDEKLYTKLRVELGISNLSPVIKGRVNLKKAPQQGFILLGIDAFIEPAFDTLWQPSHQQNEGIKLSLFRLLTEPNAVLISPKLASRLNFRVDDWLQVQTVKGEQQLRILGILDPEANNSSMMPENLLIADIATAQELLGMIGRLSRIDIKLDPDADNTTVLNRIKSALPGNTQLVSSEQEIISAREMSRAFAINLDALGLLSVLIGVFLIYNTMTFLVVQRRELFGSLRALGVTRRQIFRLIILEALGLATIGILIGMVLGVVIGYGLVDLVSGTISTFYFQNQVSSLTVTWDVLLKAAILGFFATLLAIVLPAWEATHLSPVSVMKRSQLETGARKMVVIAGFLSLIFFAVGLLLAFFSGKSISLGIASVFFLLFGFALLTPAVTLLFMKGIKLLLSRFSSILGQLPMTMVSAEISRTGVAIAALMVAIAATVGMELMINSFRQTVSEWLMVSMRADLYVSLPGDISSSYKIVSDQQLAGKIHSLEDVAMISNVLHTHVLTEQKSVRLSVFELNDRSKTGFIFKHPQDEKLWHDFEQAQAILITEPYAYHHDIGRGDQLGLRTNYGLQYFTIIGIYKDYSGDQGHLAMSRKTYLKHWGNAGFTGIGVYAKRGVNLPKLQEKIANLGYSNQVLQVRSNRAIFQESMKLFEQTFVITQTLRWLAVGIACVGVFGALMALQFERIRLFGILRAIGVTPRQLSFLILAETGLMGLVAGILAIPSGLAVAAILLFVVYQRSFGWTMAFHLEPWVLFQGLGLALVSALLAGVIPAIKMAKTSPAEALRTE